MTNDDKDKDKTITEQVKQKVGEKIKGLETGINNKTEELKNKTKIALLNTKNSVTTGISGFSDKVLAFGDAVNGRVIKNVTENKEKVLGVKKNVTDEITNIGENVGNKAKNAVGALTEGANNLQENALGKVAAFGDAVKGRFNNAKNVITGGPPKPLPAVANKISGGYGCSSGYHKRTYKNVRRFKHYKRTYKRTYKPSYKKNIRNKKQRRSRRNNK